MTELSLLLHEVPVRIACGQASILDDLRRDFDYFITDQVADTPAPIRLTLELRLPPADAERTAWLRTRRYSVGDRGPVRRITYPEGAAAEYDFQSRSGTIWCRDAQRLRELGYLAVLSRAGEELDRRGRHRVHALGWECAGLGGLLLLPSGAGKSTLALELLRSTRLGLVSDDSPLLTQDLRLLAFPLRMGFAPTADLSAVPERWQRSMLRRDFGPKRLVDLGFFRDRVRSDVPVSWLILGQRRDGAAPRLLQASRLRAAWALGLHLVLGLGIAQMSEYMLRPSLAGFRELAGIAWSRLRTALRLLRAAKPWIFVMGSDIKANASVLAAFLQREPG